jgi:predicted MFS family arabinose efflux permease
VREPSATTEKSGEDDDGEGEGASSASWVVEKEASTAYLDAFPGDFEERATGVVEEKASGETGALSKTVGGLFRNEREKNAAWSLALLTMAYCHASATGFLLPSLLPAMSADLKLGDGQGALLTTLFTVTYSLLLPFVGILADTVDRKNLLAMGAGTWTLASFMTAHSANFSALVLSRGLFAIGNGAQNPVAFSMIPELFPRNKAFALSFYNLAIHAGRAVSFASGAFVGRAPIPAGAEEHVFSNEPLTLPLTYLTEIGALGAHTILYTTADSVVLTPNVGTVLENTVGDAMLSTGMSWHEIYDVVAAPGLLIVPLILFTISDPGRTWTGSRALKRKVRMEKARRERRERERALSMDAESLVALIGSIDESDMSNETERVMATSRAVIAQSEMNGQYTSIPLKSSGFKDAFASLTSCFESEAFKKVTAASTLADVGGWSMIAFQAAFYERVFSLTPQEYDPLLALVIPLAGVTGGLGGGYICDRLQSRGPEGQRLFIAIMTMLAGPLLAASLLADDYKTSLMFLFPGMIAAEIFRSPTAVMTRDSRPETPSVAAAAHLAVRNMVAGVGPLAVAFFANKFDLRHAMLLAPACYVVAGIAYYDAIGVLTQEKIKRIEGRTS